MSSMGIGNKPCLDIRPSVDQISDRSISIAQLCKSKFFQELHEKYSYLRNISPLTFFFQKSKLNRSVNVFRKNLPT